MSRLQRVLAIGMVMGSLAGLLDRESHAAEWSAEPSLSVRGVYNSNLLLTEAPHTASYGPWVSPGVKYAGSTESLEVGGRVAADFVSYYGDETTSFTNLYFPLSVKYRGERDLLGFDGGLTRDNTLMGELQTTGVVLAFTQRNLWTASPSWTHNLTDRLALIAGYQYANATYENGLRLGLVDYETNGGNAGISYQLGEHSQVQVMGVATLFEASQVNLESKIFGGQATLNHEFSENVSLKLEGGARHVSNQQQAGSQDLTDQTWVFVGNATLLKRFERATVTLDAGRDVYPSGFGLLIVTDHLNLRIEHQLTENLTASVMGAGLLASGVATVGTGISFPRTRYLSAEPRLTWKINEWWSAETWYTYGQRDVDSLNVTANANAVTAVITYTPAKFSFSR